MGVEIFQFTLPEHVAPLQRILDGKVDGELVNKFRFLIESLRCGKDAKRYFDLLGDSLSPAEMEAVYETFEVIKSNPHIISICFDEPSRAHDHLAYLWNWAPEPRSTENN